MDPGGITPLDRSIQRWEIVCHALDVIFHLLIVIAPIAGIIYLAKTNFAFDLDLVAGSSLAAFVLLLLTWLVAHLRLAILRLKKNKS